MKWAGIASFLEHIWEHVLSNLKNVLHAFPEHVDSYLYLARLYLQKSERILAEEHLRNALSIEPENSAVLDLLAKKCT